jgi:Tfp pilus assembly protein PilP
MKLPGRMENWAVGVLGVVSLALIVYLVFQYKQMQAGVKPSGMKRLVVKTPSHPKASGPAGAKTAAGKLAGKQKVSDELSRYNSLVEVDLLKQFEDRPLPELKRNPFEFVAAPIQARREQAPGAPPAPVQPPPPPPVTLKVMGYSEGAGGVQEAMVSDEDQVFVVHAGDSVGARYKVIKITPTAVTIEDATIHQTVDLPVPQ